MAIVVPLLNEADKADDLVAQLAKTDAEQIVFVDGGSVDGTFEKLGVAIARVEQANWFKLERADRGRAVQMNHGANHSESEMVCFLHADTMLPEKAGEIIRAALLNADWGRFNLQLDSSHWMLKIVGKMINWRSRLSGIATGDQAIFIRRAVFEQLGGYPEIPLMEDIALCRKLKMLGSKPACLKKVVVTSARHWLGYGIVKTIFTMWYLRFAYWMGADPKDLAEKYTRGQN